MHYYQFNIGDYKSHTDHLDPLEDIAFRRMMDWSYLHEKQLPLDIKEVARLIRMRTHDECIAYVLSEFFEVTDIGYVNKRIAKEIAKYNEKSEKAKKSAQARWKNKAPENASLDDANALDSQSVGNAKQEPLNTKHKPLPKNKEPSADAKDISLYLQEKIKSINPNAKTNNSSWEKDIDLAIRIDKRTKTDLIKTIDWIYSSAGSFWQSNILSGKKLRDKYDTMFAQQATARPGQKDRSGFMATDYEAQSKSAGFSSEIPMRGD